MQWCVNISVLYKILILLNTVIQGFCKKKSFYGVKWNKDFNKTSDNAWSKPWNLWSSGLQLNC